MSDLGLAGIITAAAISTFGLVAFASDYSKEEIAEIAADANLDPAVLTLAGDPEYGEYLSGECTTCHQTSGDYDGIPPIVGYDEVFFKVAMHEYKQEAREHPVMRMIAGRLADDEIAALAAYFSQLQPE